MRILLVQEDAAEAAHLTDSFDRHGIFAEWMNDGLVAVKILDREEFDAVILDLALPGKSGCAVLSHLRAKRNPVPIIVLTAQDSLSNRLASFDAGADDFLARPFAFEELVARVHAVVRRSHKAEYRALTCGPLVFDIVTQRFTLDGNPMTLSFREHMLLHALIRRANRHVSKRTLFDHAFRTNEEANISAIEVLIHRLRKRLSGSSVKIVSARGFGYSLTESADDSN